MPVFGVLKEAETDETMASDKTMLGTGPFQRDYFACAKACYLDTERAFFSELGDRKITGLLKPWEIITNPLGTWSELQKVGERLKAKDVVQNMVGEGLTLGGILVIDPSGKVLFTYRENTGREIPSAEISAALSALGQT